MAIKFVCDGMLGKLCRLLRICGIDTLYSNEGMKILLEARKENRIVLTKNTQLRDKENIFFIQTSDPVIQLKDVIAHYDLRHLVQPFSRCITCNCRLESVSKESVKDKVPYFTFKHFNEFALCPGCKRVYWKGSHYERMLREIQDIFN